jgi:ribonuclease HII
MSSIPRGRQFGIDEAGRGPILGPMAIAVVGLDRRGATRLKRLGVTDSKSFGAGEAARALRAELAAEIRGRAIVCGLRLVEVDEIDRHTFCGLLNALERKVVRQLLVEHGIGREDAIVCDGANLFSRLRGEYPLLRALDRAESTHLSVAAASIVAKDARDRAFAAIAARYESEFGPVLGGGYCNDATRRFLDAYAARYGGLPPEARRSWGADKQLDMFGALAETDIAPSERE